MLMVEPIGQFRAAIHFLVARKWRNRCRTPRCAGDCTYVHSIMRHLWHPASILSAGPCGRRDTVVGARAEFCSLPALASR